MHVGHGLYLLLAIGYFGRESIHINWIHGAPMGKEYVSHCLGEALEGLESTVFSELGTMLGPLPRNARGSWFQEPHSGGLGWAFGAALGAQLAAPDRLIVATMGDGSYMFANPTVCHQIAEALELPVVVLVLNNREWGAVRHSVTGMYPDGYAAKANEVPLTGLTPSPDFTLTARASRSASVSASISRSSTSGTAPVSAG